ncbi:hypothetical protein GCM10009609_47860 [Pseudonocardia aurantiaca]
MRLQLQFEAGGGVPLAEGDSLALGIVAELSRAFEQWPAAQPTGTGETTR